MGGGEWARVHQSPPLLEVICADPRLIGLIRHYRAPGHGAALVEGRGEG